MDKILAFFAQAKKSLTVWLMSAVAILSQFDAVTNWVSSIIGALSPSKAAAVTAIIALIARAKGLITSALAALQAADAPTPTAAPQGFAGGGADKK